MKQPIYTDHGTSMRNKINVLSDYKFALAFENNNFTGMSNTEAMGRPTLQQIMSRKNFTVLTKPQLFRFIWEHRT